MKNQKFAMALCLFGLVTVVSASIATASDAILIEFSSAQCPPCRAMEPIVAQLEKRGVPVRHVDVNREHQLAIRYGIRQTPTFVVVSGGREVTRMVGMQSLAQLTKALATDPSGPFFATNSRDSYSANLTAPATRLAPINRSGEFAASLQPAPQPARVEPMPSATVAGAVERARAATVRIKVFDGHGYGVGTGTIIDTHDDEALVLTCGHLFRKTKGQGKVEVEMWVGGQSKIVSGQVIDYDSDDKDIALVAIRPGMPVQPVAVIGKGQAPRNGQVVFSFGCDRGDDPSRRDTRITGINKYNQHKNASNLEIAGAPIDGRSGGGLFDSAGTLIGLCNSADPKGDIGIYTGPGPIHWQLDRVSLAHLYQKSGVYNPDANNVQLASLQQPAPSVANSAAHPSHDINQHGQLALSAPLNNHTPPANRIASADQEVIVIIRDKNRPGNQAEVMTLQQPSADLMQMLKSQGRF